MAQEKPAEQTVNNRRSALFGLAEHVWNPERARWLLRPRWRPISATLAALAILSYLGLAAALYARDKWIRGSADTSYVEMLQVAFPDPVYFTHQRWAPGFIARRVDAARKAHAKKMATLLFNKAKTAMEAKEWGTFYQNVLAAAQIDPSNMEARMLAAQIFLQARRDDDALDTLEQALPEQLDKPDYVGQFLSVCFAQEKEERVLALSQYYLAQPDLSPAMREIFSTAMAAAHFYRGEFEACSATLSKYNLERTREGFLLDIRMLWELGRKGEAISKLEPVAMASPNDPKLLEMLIDLKTRNGDLEGARNSVSAFLLRSPDKFEARIKMIEILDTMKNTVRRDEEIAAYRRDFAHQEKAVMRLCEFCSDRGLVGLCASIVEEVSKEKEFKDIPRFRLLYIESHLAASRYAEAIALVDKIFVENPVWISGYKLEFDCLRMVAQMSLSRDDMGDISFRRLTENQTVLRMPLMTVVAKKLIQVGRPDDAIRVIDFAYERNGRALTTLGNVIEIHLDAGGTPATPMLLRSQISRRRPSTDILVKARKVMVGDAYLFEPDREKLIGDLETLIAGKPILPPVAPRKPIEKSH